MGLQKAKSLRGELAWAAQKVYDAWEESDLEGGGICHVIADEMVRVLDAHGIRACAVESEHEQHVLTAIRVEQGTYLVDIPYARYERGAGYSWTKIPGVVFDAADVLFDKVVNDSDYDDLEALWTSATT